MPNLLIFYILIVLFLIGLSAVFIWQRNVYKSKFEEYEKKYKDIRSKKKSSEVRLGQISEKLAPFLDDFPVENPQKLTFLGNPIDYIYFGDDSVVFVEVKSGKSRLNKKQRRIRDAVENGNVEWTIYRVN